MTCSLLPNNYISTENLIRDFQGVTVASSVPLNASVTSYRANDILFSNIRPYLKKSWKANMNGGCSNDVLVFRYNETCLPGFLYYLLANDDFVNYVMTGAKGVKMPRGDKLQIEQYPIYLPTKPEQSKIAAFISLLDERILTQNKIIAHLESLIKGLSQILFENNAGWEEATISEVASVVSGGTPDTSIPSFWGGDINWFTPSEIGRTKYVNSSDRTITEKGLKKSSAKLLPPNSLLLSTRATIGECSICQSTCTTNQGFQSLVATHVDYEFLYYFMRTKKSELLKKSSGSTFSEISANEVKQLKIFVPTINTQKQIANLLKSVDEKIAIETKVLSAYNLQKQTLLQRLFI